MADEMKQEECKQDSKKIASTMLKVILGLLLLVLGIGAVIRWWIPILIVFKGCIGLFLILAGIITLAIAKE